jgi:1,4-alpha-glucan branching enzyme
MVTEAAQPPAPLATIAALWPSPAQTPAPAPQLPKARAVSSPPKPVLKSARPQTVAVKFALNKPDAKSVSVCGEFNQWSIGAAPMKRRHDGQWETVLELAPGRYQYKFVIDGEWMPDPTARENIPNPHGSLNSVITVS